MATAEEMLRQGVTAHQAGDFAAAEQCYRQLLEVFPTHPTCLANLASIAAGRGQLAEAERLYREVAKAHPDFIDAHFKLGNILRRTGRPQEAALAYDEVLRRAPDTTAALVNLGLAVSDAGDWPRAAECFARAASIAPDLPDVLDLLGDALAHCGRRDAAIAALRDSVTRFPNSPRGHFNLALHLIGAGETEEAIAILEHALKLNPEYAEAHNLKGVAFDSVSRTDDAQREYRTALRIRPQFADALANLGVNLGEQGLVEEGIDSLRQSLALHPNPITGSTLLLNLMYSSRVSPEQLRDEHIAWAEAHANPFTPSKPPQKRANDGRLRVGYVFGEFRSRAARAFLESLLTHHDRQQFHVTAYANAVYKNEEGDRLRRLADKWHTVNHLNDDPLANMIRADKIDILVDLNGHAPGNRLFTFARKPAAVQISLFGYPATTGLKAMDYRITESITDQFGDAKYFYVEKLLRLPEVSWVYVPPTDAPPPNALPAARRPFTFGCLNHPGKLSDECAETWAAILKAVPKSRLVLLTAQSATAAEAMTTRFTKLGIASDRLEIVYRLPESDYLSAYQPIDLALDPFPYCGAVTTCDALWMGVPVLTLAGPDARGRQGASILHAVGVPEFIADSPEQLVNLAATWAEQRESLAELRSAIRDMMMQSPLTAAEIYVQQLEEAYRSVAYPE